ncbi:hypothetical protein E3N88_19487 [Mikania micrantha]|uniref:F-box domain-containing protein n=1 Tax=Mikania micrantha TaxID=192012 RepID=A0A5N6NNK6_9ASTR|nr:hypothetical protein E3N88_19487 [Mikania micrantha]
MVNTRAKIKKTQPEDLIGSNDDLLTEILIRLPVTSILRFKYVSEHWRWLLSHRHFALMYDKFSKSPGLFVDNIYIPFDAENLNTPPYCVKGIRILQSCNGLLLCFSYQRYAKYHVVNPTTKRIASIPSIRGGEKARRTIRFMGLAFHQTDCVHYKLVCIRGVEPAGEFQIQIYSSTTRKWKILEKTFSANTMFRYGVYWNGAVHCAPTCRNPLYFKLMDEQLQKLPLPATLGGDSDGADPMYFGESRGHLHLVDTAQHENRLHLNVYEMLMDHSGWFVKYEVRLDELPGAFPEMIHNHHHPSSPFYYEFHVFDVVRCEKEEDTFMVIRIPGKIIRYNVHDKSFKEMSNLTNYYRQPYPNASLEDSDHQSTWSRALIGSNDELGAEILLRLPVTSILLFKSVSKHWRSLLSHRHFTLRYESLSISPGLFVHDVYIHFDIENPRTRPFRSHDFCFDPCGIKVVQSCNGLLLCHSDRCSIGDRKYYVYNPTTKQLSVIPSVPGGESVRETIRFMVWHFIKQIVCTIKLFVFVV